MSSSANSTKVEIKKLPSSKKKTGDRRDSRIRIIGGQWRGRKLPVNDEDGLRPTGDRLRETLFNWLAPSIHGAKCLDAFAGAGALGFEALSRGASSTQFIELNPRNAKQLATNIQLLGCNAEVACTNFAQWQPETRTPFDIIFLDPPFSENLWQSSIEHLENHIHLAEGALVYLESPKNHAITTPGYWTQSKYKSAGQVNIALYDVKKKD